MHPLSQSGKTDFKARALLVGDPIDLRSLSTSERLATDPVAIAAGANGIAILFRYGAVVLFNVAPLEETDLLRQLNPLVQQPYASPEIESLDIHNLVSHTAQTVLEVLQSRRTHRLEWYVVLLIFVEILLSLVQIAMMTRHS
jgi:uncharacterized Rmd1/YagE family protein